jgi:hypothetical protein
MNKKIILVIALATILATGTAFADHPTGLGIGVVGGYLGEWNSGYNYGATALSLKLSGIPIYWALRVDLSEWYMSFNVMGDSYLIDQALVDKLVHWYLGLGAYVNLGLFNDSLMLSLGARLPIGLSIQPIPLLEIFFEVAPSIGLTVVPSFYFPHGGWGGGFGIRLWL